MNTQEEYEFNLEREFLFFAGPDLGSSSTVRDIKGLYF